MALPGQFQPAVPLYRHELTLEAQPTPSPLSVDPRALVIVDGWERSTSDLYLEQPAVRQPSPETQEVVPKAQKGSHSTKGGASWYCSSSSACTRGYPGGLYGAAGPALRVGDWRGRRVTITSGGRSVVVTLIDWCACPSGRVIDLYSDAFGRLAPLSQGVLRVTASW